VAEGLIPTKPYMVRAIHEWCVDNGLTPHLLAAVNAQCRVPKAYVKDGEIVLNLNYTATKDLHIDNDAIVFSARFSGVSQNLYVPMDAVKGIFARENGQGMFFELAAQTGNHAAPVTSVSEAAATENGLGNNSENNKATSQKKKPTLTIVNSK
jgi:stringent starvation protein B